MHRRAWVKAFWANKERVARYQDRFLAADLDVAFVGESLVEEMSGRWLGRDIPPLAPVRQAYYSRFSKVHGGRLEGVALGIAGACTCGTFTAVRSLGQSVRDTYET